MTDGAFASWQKRGDLSFPSGKQKENWKENFSEFIKVGKFHIKGSDNCSMLFIDLEKQKTQ